MSMSMLALAQDDGTGTDDGTTTGDVTLIGDLPGAGVVVDANGVLSVKRAVDQTGSLDRRPPYGRSAAARTRRPLS